jgi:hypothetical protein
MSLTTEKSWDGHKCFPHVSFLTTVFTQDMTKDQIANEKVALQKALLYYESIHGRPVCDASNCLIGVSCLVLERFYNLVSSSDPKTCSVFLYKKGSLMHIHTISKCF